MDFRITEEQKGLVALVRDFGKREITPELVKDVFSRPAVDRLPYIKQQGLLKKIYDIGLRTLTVPQKYGGAAVDVLTQVLVAEALGRFGWFAGHLIVPNWKVVQDLAAFGSEELQDEICTRLMTDPTFFLGEVATEPEHGCDPVLPHDEPGSGLKTFAYRDGDKYVINGEKCFTCSAQTDILGTYVRTNRDKPLSQSMSLILVPTNTPGFSCERVNEFLHDVLRPNGDPIYDNVRVPARYLVGKENEAHPIFEGRRAFWLPVLAILLGATETIYEVTKEYAKTRIQGGQPIFYHPTIGTRIVEMYSKIEDLKLKIYKTAWEIDQAIQTGRKLVSSLGFNLCNAAVHDVMELVAGHAAEVWGGRAALKGLPIEAYIRVVWGNHHGFGTSTFNRIKCMSLLEEIPVFGPATVS